mgnify:CR=1 FL=1
MADVEPVNDINENVEDEQNCGQKGAAIRKRKSGYRLSVWSNGFRFP